jgi:hypothetical protein
VDLRVVQLAVCGRCCAVRFVDSPNQSPQLTKWALLGSAALMEIPIAMILASRLVPFRANRLALSRGLMIARVEQNEVSRTDGAAARD